MSSVVVLVIIVRRVSNDELAATSWAWWQLPRCAARPQWQRIAAELGTGRPAVDCLARFQRELNPELLRRPWTHEEGRRLADAVAKHGRHWAVRGLRAAGFLGL